MSYSNLNRRYLERPTYHRVLGKGMMGDVVEMIYAGTPVAMKTIPLHGDFFEKRIVKDDGKYDAFINEINALSELRHPNIVTMIAHSQDTILLELYDGPANKINTLKELSIVARDCMRAIIFMSTYPKCAMHGDIKPGNILIKKNGNGKIIQASLADLGLARFCKGSGEFSGTPGYMPLPNPESNNGHDVYALAVSLMNAYLSINVHAAYKGDMIDVVLVDNTHESSQMFPGPIPMVLGLMLDMYRQNRSTVETRQRTFFNLLNRWEDIVSTLTENEDAYEITEDDEIHMPPSVPDVPDKSMETTVYPPGFFDEIKQTWGQWLKGESALPHDYVFRDFHISEHKRKYNETRGFRGDEHTPVPRPIRLRQQREEERTERAEKNRIKRLEAIKEEEEYQRENKIRKERQRLIDNIPNIPFGPGHMDFVTLMRRHKEIANEEERIEHIQKSYIFK